MQVKKTEFRLVLLNAGTTSSVWRNFNTDIINSYGSSYNHYTWKKTLGYELSKYNAEYTFMDDDAKLCAYFETEEDMAFFVLKWS
jgi:hypothetical protein